MSAGTCVSKYGALMLSGDASPRTWRWWLKEHLGKCVVGPGGEVKG